MAIRVWATRVVAVIALTALWEAPVRATETDQFLSWLVEIEDSLDALNRFMNEELGVLLRRLRAEPRDVECSRVPMLYYEQIFPNMLDSRIRRHLYLVAEIDKFPSAEMGYGEYRNASLYRKPLFPYILPMARTIEVGGIRLGTDKLGHMLGLSRYYYRRYHRGRRRGETVDEALARAVRWGARAESKIVGGLVDGVFSYADLEANFQGLQLARRFCEGTERFLESTDSGWRQARVIDMREFINPGFDETYNINYYTRFRWHRVEPILLERYCPQLQSQFVQERFERYRAIDRPSFSRRLLQEEWQDRGRFVQAKQRLENICDGSPGTPVEAGIEADDG